MVRQYYSKLHKKWKDLKPTDSEAKLKQYKYKFREKPKARSKK